MPCVKITLRSANDLIHEHKSLDKESDGQRGSKQIVHKKVHKSQLTSSGKTERSLGFFDSIYTISLTTITANCCQHYLHLAGLAQFAVQLATQLGVLVFPLLG